ncbi:hypothetical protein [Halobacillus sp. BBL2006]|uniref:hypothetical protein n=1 Tax=Halobacillus sp. BBL2006 TaxID=1543706 RepID=UPI0005429362|nr:hypothetical protein [Halobacillus sp. BBL2006]KHE73187.1 hypothetical protein LD39_00500 [Halobacillus sp. BBL2006]
MDGTLHLRQAGVYIDLEKEQKEKGIGDRKEGSWSRHMPKDSLIVLTHPNTGQKLSYKVKHGVFNTRNDAIRLVPISCFTYLSWEEDFDVDADGIGKIKADVAEELIEQFGERKVVAIQPQDFFRTLGNVNQDGLKLGYGFVQYYDDQKEPHPVSEEQYDKYPIPALFCKRRFFEFQREFRVVLPKQVENLDTFIDIGDIRDYTFTLDVCELSEKKFGISDEK